MYCTECGAKVPDGSTYCVMCGALIKEEIAASPVQMAPQPTRERRRSGALTLLLCFLCLILMFVFEVIGYLVGYALGADPIVAGSLGSALGGILSILVLGGKEWVKPKGDAFLASLEEGWWVVAISVGLVAASLLLAVLSGETIVEKGWVLRFVSLALLCTGIGISEEAMFRALVFGGILDVTGKDRRGVYIAAVISSVLFGFAHIDWTSLDYANIWDWLQVVLKITQTGLLAFFLASVALHTGTITGVAFLHGMSDFILMMPAYALLESTEEIAYVASGSDALVTVVLYVIFIGLYIPLVLKGRKLFQQASVPNYGPFHK